MQQSSQSSTSGSWIGTGTEGTEVLARTGTKVPMPEEDTLHRPLSLGLLDGLLDGLLVGVFVGVFVGLLVGLSDGDVVGDSVGELVGGKEGGAS